MAEHILVVRPPIEEGHVPQYAVECPGVTDACRMWWECDKPDCPPFSPHTTEEDEAIDNGFVQHDREHRLLDGLEWCVPTDRCWFASYDDLEGAVDALALPGSGRYPVRRGAWQAGDDATVLRLELIPGEVDRAA